MGKLTIDKKTLKEMRKQIEETKTRVQSCFNQNSLDKNGHQYFMQLAEENKKVFDEIAKAVEEGQEVDKNTLQNWKNLLTAQKKSLHAHQASFADHEVTRNSYSAMGRSLKAMELRTDEYIKAIKPGENTCKISVIEDAHQKLMDDAALEEQKAKEQKAAEKKAAAEPKKAAEQKAAAEPKKAAAEPKKAAEQKAAGEPKKLTDLSFRELGSELAATNKKFFTKQSDQFDDFRKCVKAMTEELAKSNGQVTEANAEKVAKISIAIKMAALKYKQHCAKHPQSNAIRERRVELVTAVAKKVDEMGNNKLLDNAVKNVIDHFDKKTNEESIMKDITLPKKNIHFLDEFIGEKQELPKTAKKSVETAEAGTDTMDIGIAQM